MTDYQLIKKSGTISISANDLVLADHPPFLSNLHKQSVFFKTTLSLKDTTPLIGCFRKLRMQAAGNKVADFSPFDYPVFKYPLFIYLKGYYYTLNHEKQYEFNLKANTIV